MVFAAAGVERGIAKETGIGAFEVAADAGLRSADAAKNGGHIPLGARPLLRHMTGECVVTIPAGVPDVAALHPDGDDVARRMVMRAARLGVHVEAKHGRAQRHYAAAGMAVFSCHLSISTPRTRSHSANTSMAAIMGSRKNGEDTAGATMIASMPATNEMPATAITTPSHFGR